MKESTMPALQKSKEMEPKREETRERRRVQTPPADIFEMKDALVVVVDMPGVSNQDIDVRVENDLLTIEGKTSKEEEPGESLYREYELVNYFRQFQLGKAVDQEKIDAELKYGVLTIRLPKTEKSKPKQIAVKVS